ncbi:MAG: response regulator [Deltaproteobacteria bacterium]|nr:response regulator [Deltaproteobacteria bacterium]
MKILIVDDQEDGRLLLKKVLERDGHQVAETTNGEQALEAARVFPPDMIISDILMPQMDGFELCREVRADVKLAHIPFIFYTATYKDPRDEELAMVAGADRFVLKPMAPRAFSELISQVVRETREKGRERPRARDMAETAVMKLYNERLVKKLEKKLLDLDQEVRRRQRLEEALRKSEKSLLVLNRMARIFLTCPGEEMYDEVLRALLEVTGSRYGAFGFLDEQGNFVCPTLSREVWDQCRVQEKTTVFPKDTWGGLWGRALREKRSFIANEGLKVPEGHIPLSRALVVPILRQDRLVGAFSLAEKAQDYTQEDLRFVERIARYIAPILITRLENERREREKERLSEQLRQAQKMEAIGVLAGGVAHDFNNLLTLILGQAELMSLNLGEQNSIKQGVEEIIRAAKSAASLTRQLLTFSRKQVIQPKILNLNDVLTGIEKMLQSILGEDVELILRKAPDLERVKADPVQMEQVVMNLVVNARDAMPTGGKLIIETANAELDHAYFMARGLEGTPGRFTQLTVTDTGAGMDRETRRRIFEPFFTTKGLGRGTGLGLATVYGIVKQAGGYVWVYSEPAQGASFRIYLPVSDGEEADSAEKAPRAGAQGSETVLVVEDDEMIRALACRILEHYGYRVLEAGNGKDALEKARTHQGPIQLLLTDVALPRMVGKDLAVALLKDRPDTRVIYMSGYTDEIIARRGVLEESVDFLEKPFTPASLAQKVREVLDR